MTETAAKATLHQRAMHELKEFTILALYLYITLGAVIIIKTAVLHSVGIEVALWGVAFIKALVLAKFMLIGFAMKFDKHETTGPLIWPTLRMAAAFLGLLIIMTVIEEVVVGLFHHRPMTESLGDLFGVRLEETLAGYLIMLLVLIPFFAFRVLSAALGKGMLERMFFAKGGLIERK